MKRIASTSRSISRRLHCLLTGILFFLSIHGGASQTNRLLLMDSLRQVIDTSRQLDTKAALLNKLAFMCLEVDVSKAQDYARQALQLAENQALDDQIALAYNTLACGFVYRSDFDNALIYFDKALLQHEKRGDQKGMSDVLGNMGYVYYYQGNYDVALEYMFRALRLFEQLALKRGEGNTLCAIGNVYLEQKIYEKALFYDSLALVRYQEIEYWDGVATIKGNVANIYRETGRLEEAEKNCDEAIRLYKQTGSKSGLGRALTNLASVYLEQRDYKKSLIALQRAYTCLNELQYQTGIIMTLGNIGTSYARSAQYYQHPDSVISIIPGALPELRQKAIQYLTQAVELAEKSAELSPLSVFSKSLAEQYRQQGNFQQAFVYAEKHHTAQDSLNSTESRVQIEKLTTQREVDLKNKQIELDRLAIEKKRNERAYFVAGLVLLALLLLFIYRNYRNQKSANAQLEVKNGRLSKALKELGETQDQLIETEKQKEKALLRGKISQDIHDDISSNLTKISLLSELLTVKSAASPAPADPGLVEKINYFSREAVAKLGEIIWSTNPERDNLESLLAYMRNFLHKYLEDATMRCEIHFPEDLLTDPIHPELRRNLFLVLKESVHNAVKYSQGARLEVDFQYTPGHYRLIVADDGVGIPSDAHGAGNGLNNMKKRMAAVGGHVVVESAPGKGTRIEFSGALFA